jgi:hypothetical protein
MPVDGQAPERPVTGRLDERVLETLEGLPGRLAFSGLRRVLGAHPESLTRALGRLEREGRVEKVDGGYRARPSSRHARDGPAPDLRSIARVELPPGLPSETVLGRLAGRWFGSLRWVGTVDRSSDRLLAWAQRDGNGMALLGVGRGSVQVYVPGGTWGDASEAEETAYELLAHAVEALRPSGSEESPELPLKAFTASAPLAALEN